MPTKTHHQLPGKMRGGRKLGEGKSAVVLDSCNHTDQDTDTICKFLESELQDSDVIIIYTFNKEAKVEAYQLDKQDNMNFIRSLSNDENRNMTAKIYKNAFRLFGLGVDAKESFQEEVNGVSRLINSFGLNVTTELTPIRFIKYKNFDIFGMHVNKSVFGNLRRMSFRDIWISFSEKCSATLEDISKPEEGFDQQILLNVIEDLASSTI